MKGAVYLCPTCGQTAATEEGLKALPCTPHSVLLVDDDSIERDPKTGRVIDCRSASVSRIAAMARRSVV